MYENAELYINWDKLIQHNLYCNFCNDCVIANIKIYEDLTDTSLSINELWKKYISDPFYETLDNKEKSDIYNKIYDETEIIDVGCESVDVKIR